MQSHFFVPLGNACAGRIIAVAVCCISMPMRLWSLLCPCCSLHCFAVAFRGFSSPLLRYGLPVPIVAVQSLCTAWLFNAFASLGIAIASRDFAFAFSCYSLPVQGGAKPCLRRGCHCGAEQVYASAVRRQAKPRRCCHLLNNAKAELFFEMPVHSLTHQCQRRASLNYAAALQYSATPKLCFLRICRYRACSAPALERKALASRFWALPSLLSGL